MSVLSLLGNFRKVSSSLDSLGFILHHRVKCTKLKRIELFTINQHIVAKKVNTRCKYVFSHETFSNEKELS